MFCCLNRIAEGLVGFAACGRIVMIEPNAEWGAPPLCERLAGLASQNKSGTALAAGSLR